MRIGKKLSLWSILFGLTYLAVEGIALIAFFWIKGNLFSFAAMEAQRLEIFREDPRSACLPPEREARGWTFEKSILHPYLGFAREPRPVDVHSYGFWKIPQKESTDEDHLTIAVVGGSVAESFFHHIARSGEWPGILRAAPGFEGKTFDHILLGLRGYKQPQQLLAVAYYLSLGGHLDIIINLDGYNEVGLAGQLYDKGVFPAYPFHWLPLTKDKVRPHELNIAGGIFLFRNTRYRAATIADHLSFSVAANVIWYLFDHYLNIKILERQRELEISSSGDAGEPYYRVGPTVALEGWDFYPWAAELWMTSSLQLHNLAEANDIYYFHFLQPNQYVPGSKALSFVEADRFYDETNSHCHHVRKGYPELIKVGRNLAERGFYHDLTGIFQEVQETVYSDSCCHLNNLGNRLLARKIGSIIHDFFAEGQDNS